MKPKSILDPDFKYIPAAKTDLKKTFARIRRELKEAKAQQDLKVLHPNFKEKERKDG